MKYNKQILTHLLLGPLFLVMIGFVIYVSIIANNQNSTPISKETPSPKIVTNQPTSTPKTTTQPKEDTPKKKDPPKTTPHQSTPATSKPAPPQATPQPQPTPQPSPVNPALFAQDSNLYNELAVIGKYSAPNINLRYSSDMTGSCGWSSAGGCYYTNINTIYIIETMQNEQGSRRDILAHEYMHYVWYNMGIDTPSLRTILQNKYASSPELQAVIDSHYIENGQVDPTEILSYSCTILNQAQMGPDIFNICNTYLRLNYLSSFITSNTGRLVDAINYRRQKNTQSLVTINNSLSDAANKGLVSILRGDNEATFQQAIAPSVWPICGSRQYLIGIAFVKSSDELEIADELITQSAGSPVAADATIIGVGIQKPAYLNPHTSPIIDNPTALVNTNVILTISC